MSTAGIVLIAGASIIVLAAIVLLVTAASRSDARRGEGALSRETVSRDESARREAEPILVSAAQPSTEVERAARSTAVVKAPPAAPVAYVPPDAETIGVTRRQFFNRGLITLMGASLGAFGAACLGFLWY